MPPMFRALSLSLRRLASQPTFAVTAIVTLALGIGASTAIYSIAYGVLLRPLPFPDPDRLVALVQVDAKGQQMRFSRANFADVERSARSFDAMARYSAGLAAVVGGTEPVRVTTAYVSARFLDVVGVAPRLGRGFAAGEVTEGGPPSAHRPCLLATARADTSVAQAGQEVGAIARELKATHGDDTWMSDALTVPLRDTLIGDATGVIALLAGAVGFLLLVSCATVANLLLAQGVLRAQEFAVRQAVGATWGQLLRQVVTEHLVLVALGGAVGASNACAVAWWCCRWPSRWCCSSAPACWVSVC